MYRLFLLVLSDVLTVHNLTTLAYTLSLSQLTTHKRHQSHCHRPKLRPQAKERNRLLLECTTFRSLSPLSIRCECFDHLCKTVHDQCQRDINLFVKVGYNAITFFRLKKYHPSLYYTGPHTEYILLQYGISAYSWPSTKFLAIL